MDFPLHSAFVAIPLTGQAKRQFHAYHEALKPFEDFLRLQKPETPHLTLRFWRSLMEIEYYQVMAECENVARHAKPFMLPIEGFETFNHKGIDSVVFLKPVFSPELATVKKLCPWPNEQPFHPHITIARVSHPQKFIVHKKKVLKALEDVAFTMEVDRIALYASVNGVNQTVLKEFGFPG